MDWGLEAVVKGCSSIEAAPTTTMEDPFLNFSFHNNNFFSSEEDDMFFSFPEFSESTRVLDELEELYKPFYPVLHTSTLISPQTMVTIPQPIPPKEPEEDVKVKPSQKVVAPQDLQQIIPSASKSKRSKKNLNKRVVKQVRAAEIGVCDAWAWRKYGQKPIKGSPYPRSYYRCSSSKGCFARKQVERNHLDPGVFLISYTAEHNHPHPTRRNSLAGSTRKNNSLVASTITSTTCCDDDKNKTNNTCSSSSNSSSAVMSLSPRTPLVVQSMEDEIVTSVEEQSSINNNNKAGWKEEEDFVIELLDNDEGAEFGDDDDWFSNTQNIDHEMMGLDYRQLEMEIEINGCDFMDGFAAAT